VENTIKQIGERTITTYFRTSIKGSFMHKEWLEVASKTVLDAHLAAGAGIGVGVTHAYIGPICHKILVIYLTANTGQ
jgi:hypothetical protein